MKCLIHMYVCTYYVVLKMTSIECILLENTFGMNRVHHWSSWSLSKSSMIARIVVAVQPGYDAAKLVTG